MKQRHFPNIVRILIQTLLTATLYYLSARLGFLMALPPGNVTALWPPSGLALVMMLIFGWRASPGIFIASFLVNWEILNGPAALPVAAAIATASTLQAWVTAWLLYRFIKTWPPEKVQHTLLAIGITSFSALQSPVVGVTSLCLAGLAPWENFLILAGTWWLGDLIGMLVFAPMPFILYKRWKQQPVSEPFLWPLTCLILGVSLFAFLFINNMEKQVLVASPGRVAGAGLFVGLLMVSAFLAFVKRRQRIEEALRQKEAEYRLIAENTGDVIWLFDLETQKFTYVSPSVEKLRGFTSHEVLSQSLSDVFTPDSYDFVLWLLPKRSAVFLRDHISVTYTDILGQVRKDGSVVTTEISSSFVLNEAGKLQMVGISRDITERKQADEKILRLNRLYATLNQINQAIMHPHTPESLFAEICHIAVEYGQFRMAWIGLIDPMEAVVKPAAFAGEELGYLANIKIKLKEDLLGQGPMAAAIRNGQCVVCQDISSDPHMIPWREQALQRGYHSLASVSFRRNGQVIGALTVYSAQPQAFSIDENELLEEIGRDISHALEFIDTETQRQQAAILQETVYRIAEAAQEVESLQNLYFQIHLQIAKVMYAENFYIALYNETEDLLHFVYSVDEKDPELVQPMRPGIGFTSQVLRTGTSLLVAPQQPGLEFVGTASSLWLGVPLNLRGKTIGVMAIQHYSDPHAYTEREKNMLEFVSSQVAAAIDSKRQEEAFRQIEKRNRSLIEHAPDGIALLDANGLVKFASSSAYRMFGYELHEVTGINALSLTHPDDKPRVMMKFRRLLRDPLAGFNLEYRFIRKNGSYGWLECIFTNLIDDPGVHAIVANFRDITERKFASEMLQKSQASLETAQSIAHLGSWEFDPVSGQGISCSKELFRLLERDPALGLPGLPDFLAIFHPEDRPLLMDAQQRAIASNSLITGEYRVLLPLQGLRHYKATFRPAWAVHGQQLYVSGTVLDITEVKSARLELEELNRSLEQRVEERTAEVRQSEAIYRALFENSNDGIFLLSPQKVELQANQRALDMLGYTAEEYQNIGNQHKRIQEPSQIQDADARFEAILRGERVPLYERTLIAKNGEKIEVEINLSAIRDAAGKVIMVQSVVRDISERKRAEKMLKDTSELFNEIMRHSPIYTFVKEVSETSSVVRYCSDNYINMTGISSADMVGKCMSEIFPLDFAQKIISDDWSVVRNNRVIRLDEDLDGRNYTSIKFPIFQGDRILLAGYTIDITERKQAEETLRESRDKLHSANLALEKASLAKDEFLANMSHELRTPLNGILGLSEVLLDGRRGPLNPVQQKYIHTIDASGRHLLSLINDILDLSKIEAGKLELHIETVAVADVCHASLAFVKEPASKKGLRIDFRLDQSVPIIKADVRRLKQILVNLLSNAVKFTLSGGKVLLETCANREQGYLEFRVSDTGIGIESQDLNRLFAPFTQVDSSLTRQHEGTGLGLALVKRLVELHGGVITATSEVGTGSCFTVSLPWQPAPASHENPSPMVASQPARPQPESQPIINTPVSAGKVLLAEDTETNILTIGDFLESVGYQLEVARNGQEALERAEAFKPDVILMDVQMPVMDGLVAIRHLRANPHFATIPIIALTALAMPGDRERCLEVGASEYVSKPVGLRQLAELLNRLLRKNG